MSRAYNSRIILTSLLLVLSFCLHNPIAANASVIDQTVDGMSGFQIEGDTKVWLDITNPNIFGQTWGVMDTWATANGWRFATHAEFVELLLAVIPTGLYHSDVYDDLETGHFNQNEVDIMGADVGPGGPPEEIQFFSGFIDHSFDARHIGVFEEADPSGLYHSYWGVAEWASEADIIYYGRESALLIKDLEGEPVPEPATMLLLGSIILGLVVFRKKLMG